MRTKNLWLGLMTISMASALLLASGCSASSNSTARSNKDANSVTNGGTSSTVNGTGSQPGYVITDASKTNGGSTSGDGEVVPCTNGDDCVCPTLSVAVIGTPGKWGAASNSNGEDSDTAFQDWLNSSSAGTAKVDNYVVKPTLTPDFLAGYNVIILAGLGNDSNMGPWWAFDSATEIPAMQDWVTNKGGGVIALSGYAGDGNEVDAKNALLAFSGISYNKDGISPPCALVDATNNQLCWCGGSQPITEWNKTDPVVEKLSWGVTMVGMQNGRTINAPADAHVAATTTNGSTVSKLVVGKIVGQGRVLFFTDEWITYTSQWNGVGNTNTNNPACTGYLPQDKYQTAQFWYNMIRWTQPNATCFKIVDKQQAVTVW